MEASSRMGPSPLVRTYLIPLALVSVVLAVLMDRGRFPTDDRIILIVVIAVAAVVYLRDRRLIVAALAFTIASWALDAGGASDWAAWAVARTLDDPDPLPIRNLDPAWEDLIARSGRFNEAARLYGYVALNALAFAALLAGARLLSRRRALHDPSLSG